MLPQIREALAARQDADFMFRAVQAHRVDSPNHACAVDQNLHGATSGLAINVETRSANTLLVDGLDDPRQVRECRTVR